MRLQGAAATFTLVASLGPCGGSPVPSPAPPPVPSAPPARSATTPAPSTVACGDVAGPWSSTVDGLRARLVTAGSTPARASLDITLEVENVAGREPIELHFTGDLPLGFVTFRLDDATGNDALPAWRFGGSAMSGEVRAVFPVSRIVRYRVHRGAFTAMNGNRVLRIYAFWGRELPSDGSKRFLRAVLTAGPTHPYAPAYVGEEGLATPPRARVWSGTLEVPPVCIE